MSLINVTFDDFDAQIGYANPADWSTPNPQDNPSWFNETSDVTGSIWHEATYHYTNVMGASATFNFTGSTFSIYGGAGPSFSNYTVTIDPLSSSPYIYNGSAYASANSSSDTGRFLLYETSELTYSPHEVVIANQGGGLLLDLIVIEQELGATGATLTNTTLDETSSEITYNGPWTEESNPLFYGGTAIYANKSVDTGSTEISFNFSFVGTAFYIWGDQVNDNGLFSIFINDSSDPVATLTGRSGCDGEFRKYCEKLGELKFYMGNLPEGTHQVKLVDEETFFNLDRVAYTATSQYSTQSITSNSTCPFTNCSSSSTASTTGTMSTAASGTATASTTSSAGERAIMVGVSWARQWVGVIVGGVVLGRVLAVV